MLELTEEMSGKTFDIDVYALQYNIFEIIGGMGNFKFS